MSLLSKFRQLASSRFTAIEGQSVPKQIEFFQTFLREHAEIQQILEIGFNGGLSAATFLSSRDDVQLVSFDLGRHPYVSTAKEVIEEVFPGRHRLILGDSRQTLPAFLASEPVARHAYDLVYVDGGHVDPVPASDLSYARQLLKPAGWVILDDYCPKFGGHGVCSAWDAALAAREFVQVGPAHTVGDRGWVCGQPTTG
jgi:predicted O-methyltransferase YrrM